MRMWMVDPKVLCRNHLLGEHLELHILVSKINERRKIEGFIEHGLVDPALATMRHEELAGEMKRRGYHHTSPLAKITGKMVRGKVDSDANLRVLKERCEKCRERMD